MPSSVRSVSSTRSLRPRTTTSTNVATTTTTTTATNTATTTANQFASLQQEGTVPPPRGYNRVTAELDLETLSAEMQIVRDKYREAYLRIERDDASNPLLQRYAHDFPPLTPAQAGPQRQSTRNRQGAIPKIPTQPSKQV
ncbi:uncharacterized protein LOC126879043 [Diabrotica virgifera virgifera]|uniref:Uncharacterized protein n=1 Tax=Diabrotica virgifera virgifera TaxID=50390 RepID=A0ABM5JIX9_DIAVI|nr:uncharacterized protein LOC126879043 [Diabrotica virgifera virgifera]